MDSPSVQHVKRIAGTVAECQHDMVGMDGFTVFQYDSPDLPVFDQQIVHPGLKAEFSAK